MILLLFHETEPPSILTSMFVSFVMGNETNHGAARDLMPYQHASNWRVQERTLYGENRPNADILVAASKHASRLLFRRRRSRLRQ